MQNQPFVKAEPGAPATLRIPHVGEVVRVRGARWRLADVRCYDRCALLTLAGLGPGNAGLTQHVIAPFDRVEPIDHRSRPKLVGSALWRRACRALIARHTPPGGLKTARHVRMDLLPYQLEPALALVRGLGSRVLLADDVGLGKTIQAGLVISELRVRGAADRVLILTPAGLREQWSHELRQRFGVDGSIVDAAALRRLVATLPVGVNPWTTTPMSITSIDYIKRPEVLAALLSCRWDVVVVDEAHATVGPTDRHAAVSALASRAPYVVLATATPHSGDRDAFASLCGAGSVEGDPLLVFRRTRHDVGFNLVRKVHRLSVRPSALEARMHGLLIRFAHAVRNERGEGASLALSVLHKRAFSSASSLARSVGRRLVTLSAVGENGIDQLVLPLGDASGERCADDEAPPWPSGLELHDIRRERRLLQALAEAAEAASRHESKIAALQRLLRRINEPAIVFTEYRDTLLHLQQELDRRTAVLHGGMRGEDRIASLDRFGRGNDIVLLATDAAGQGLNLHHACRVVINLELPWNPTRLEQRIGRVDRIGQRRTVHAFHLVARDTGESLILERLQARITRARADIRMSDPLGADIEHEVVRLVIGGVEIESRSAEQSSSGAIERAMRIEPELSQEAVVEAERLARARLISQVDDDKALACLETSGPALRRARRWQTRSRLGSRLILLWGVTSEDGAGRAVDSTLVPLSFELGQGHADIDRILGRFDADFRHAVDLTTENWRRETQRLHHAFTAARLHRERAPARPAASEQNLFQAGLFDRRVQVARGVSAAAAQDDEVNRLARLAMLERTMALVALPARLLLVLMP